MSCGAQDPGNELPALQWETREKFLALGAAFCRQTGGRYFLRVRKGTGGRRSCAQQNNIFASGRSVPGEVATHAQGCQSWHVTGRAVDCDIIDSTTGNQVGESLYAQAGAIWQSMGGTWGGNFPGFPDIGHFEWHPELTVSAVCPIPSACSDAAVDTIGPGSWMWALGGVLVTGAAAYVFWEDIEAVIARARHA